MKTRIVKVLPILLMIIIYTVFFCKGILHATSITAGSYHTIALGDNGTVWTWGLNYYGQLGDGTLENRSIPVQVPGIDNAVAIGAGGYISAVIRNDKTAWAWGRNNNGQIGDGTTENKSIPVQILSLNNVIAITNGGNHTIALKDDGTVWTWGLNQYGQLGHGTNNSRTTPMQVNSLSNVTAIAAGGNYTISLKDDKTVWTWGFNFYGQLGDGTNENRKSPVQVLDNVTGIAGGGTHMIVVRNDGTVWTWGRNNKGQLGDGSTEDRNIPSQVFSIDNVVAVGAGTNHSIALKNDGTVWAWGDNEYGQLGDGTAENKSTPVQIVQHFLNSPLRSGAVVSLDNITDIIAKKNHSIALRNDGTILTWGYNAQGQLGDGTIIDRHTPVQVKGLWGQDYVIISASPTSKNFDPTKIRNTSPPQSFEISNTGTASLAIESASVTGTDATEFSIQNDNCSNQAIGPSGTCTMEAVFSPTTEGNKTATIEINSNDPNTPTLAMKLNGKATGPVVSVLPESHNFGSVKVSTSSLPQSFEISNTGSADLMIESFTLTSTDPGDFSIQDDNNCSGKTLAPSSVCTIKAIFSPISNSSKNANIEIKSDDPGKPTINIPLSGTGTQAAISVSPISHDFGMTDADTISPAKSFEISNPGSANLVIGTVTIKGTDPSEFGIDTDNCSSQTLTPLSACIVKAVFLPKSKGPKSANIEIPSDAPDTPSIVQLNGTGIKPAILTVCDSGCDYGTIRSAIDNAWDGDIIMVGSGIYNEKINTGEKNVTLKVTAFKKGDYNGDGMIDLAEVIHALQVIADIKP